MRTYPAIDVRSGSSDLIAALVDDFEPTALEEGSESTRIFFTDSSRRDAARAALISAGYDVRPADVEDEDWARRSQQNLTAVTVGRLVISPPWAIGTSSAMASDPSQPFITVVIEPSMGFGTAHHATTRLCLRALQACDVSGCFVLDVGTGSGVLALAASRLGAAHALGIDYDADAIASARDNLLLNPEVDHVDFREWDLEREELPKADIVTANLTGALLIRSARLLRSIGRADTRFIVSGLLENERDAVVQAFEINGRHDEHDTDGPLPSRISVVWEEHEDGWVGLVLCCN